MDNSREFEAKIDNIIFNLKDMESTLTTKDAFKQIIKCSWVILVNTWNSLNKAAHKYPWVFIISILIASSIISIVNIGKARAERDYSTKKLISVQQRLDSVECALDIKSLKHK